MDKNGLLLSAVSVTILEDGKSVRRFELQRDQHGRLWEAKPFETCYRNGSGQLAVAKGLVLTRY